ncbi:MAG: polysaccharide biosynthesis/export family protein [Pseudomonadota bacterium]
MRKTVIAYFLLVFISACAVDRTFGTADSIEVTDLDALPEPRGQIYYAIGPQEALDILVVGAEDLSGRYLTDEEGHIIFPYLGLIETGDKSPNEAAKIIAEGLAGRIVKDPQVRVIPEEFPEPSISIGGQVTRPGSYPVAGSRPTLLRVINQAEGLDRYAKTTDVLVMRNVDGQNYIGLYDVEAIQRGNYPDPVLYPNDIVMVGDNPAARRFDDILSFAPILSSSVILIDRLGR